MIDQQDLKRIRRALEDKESPRVYGEDRGGRMITLLVLKLVDFEDSSQLLLRETRTGRYRTLDIEKGKWNSATLIQDSLFAKKRAKAGKARWKEKKENEAK